LEGFRALRQAKMNQGRFNRHDVAKNPITDTFDQIYTVNVSIGTPAQQFRVFLATDINNLWVPDVSCQTSGGCQNKATFDNSTSSTYQSDGRQATTEPIIGPLDGFYGIDTITFGESSSGQIAVKNTNFVQVPDFPEYLDNYDLDGFLGLTYQPNSVDNVTSFFQNAIDQNLLNKNLFTIWLKADGLDAVDQPGGQFTFGDFDTEHCSPSVTYIQVTSDSLWKFNLDGTSLNGKKTLKSLTTLTATDAGQIYLPKSIFDDLISETNAWFNFDYGLYQIDCDTKFKFGLLFGEEELIVDETLGIMKMGDICILGFYGYSPPNADLVLGEVFLRQFCSIYDISGKIGFAKALSN